MTVARAAQTKDSPGTVSYWWPIASARSLCESIR